MNQKYLIRIAELECQLRQKDQQLSLVEETEAFLRSALARAEEKIEEDEREIEHLRAQIEKLRRMLFGTRSEKLRREVEQAEALLKQREQDSDRYSGREDDPQVPRQLRQSLNRPGFPGECFICELRLPDHRFRWKHNKLFLLLPEEYGPAFPAIVDYYTSPPT